jgi:hypothetical protein
MMCSVIRSLQKAIKARRKSPSRNAKSKKPQVQAQDDLERGE